MNAEVKKLWLAALRSGKFRPGKKALCKITQNGTKNYCCLGVLSELAARRGIVDRKKGCNMMKFGEEMGYLPKKVMNWAGLKGKNPMLNTKTCTYINDSGNYTQKEIANLIEKYL